MSDSPGLGDAVLAALGRIVANFTQLERCADRLLAGFITPPDVAIILTAGEGIQWKLDRLSVIAAETLADSQAGPMLLAWVKAARILVDRRNKLIHSVYLVREEEQPLTRMKASTRGGKWKGESEPIEAADLREVADLLAEGLEAADQLVKQLTGCPNWHDPADPS